MVKTTLVDSLETIRGWVAYLGECMNASQRAMP